MADIGKDEENYLRVILLLLKGCKHITLEVLLRAVRVMEEESGKDLDDVLKDAKGILNSVFDSNQRKKLFPDGDAKAQTDTWDISLITSVILKCYKSSLTPLELQAVKTIKYEHNTVLAHSRVASLSYEDYYNFRRKLEHAVNILSSTFDRSVQQECKQLVNQSLKGNLQTAKEDLKTVKDNDSFCKVLLNRIEEVEQQNKDLITRIKRRFEETKGRDFSTEQDLSTDFKRLLKKEEDQVFSTEHDLSTVFKQLHMKQGDQVFSTEHDTERLTLILGETVIEGWLNITYYTREEKLELKCEGRTNMFSFLFISKLALFVERLPYLKSVTLRQMKIGRQNIDSLELTYKEIQDIVKFKENKRELIKVCVRIFGRSLCTELGKFDKEDFEIECKKENSFADSVILNLIANELTKAHEEVTATIPSVFVGDKEPTLICIVKQKTQLQEFRDFPVKTAPMEFLSKASIKAENSINRNSEEYRSVVKDNIVDINEVISHHSERLLSEHSNIEAIRASFVKQGQLTTEPNSPCVVIYCRVKGAVPYKENLFPKTLPHPKKEISYPTDIRIGYFSFCYGATDWNQELAMGCSIGERNKDVGGTLGPFVNVVETNELCFLTARHVFPPYSSRTDDQILKATVVQPSNYHLSQHSYKGPDRECGEVVACALNEEIDAALVKINENRKPSRGLFVDVARGDFLLAGLSAKQISAFDDGEVLDVSGLTVQDNACRPILKIGVTSGLTKGYLSTTDGVVNLTEEFQTLEASYGTQREFHRMRGQITVDSLSKKAFCQSGDSGAGVFILNSDMRLQCIGMIIGMMPDNTAIVTPIQRILDALKDKYGKGELQLKTFSLEDMETND